ncbi:DoxX family membrane protein [Pedobacter sp. ASV28]|uniref:MauE/DoxX family redox-associated membrane protein n=1 Tax=Pedobacter sp. ASV28 TaxID=2795123 RepID=UPI0018ED92D4|nr:DoxX family membrane protein [Pedobacter sp. ASV28]
MKIVKNILCALFGLMFLNAGLDKYFHYMPMPELPANMMKVVEAFGTIKWLMPLVAFIEISGGLLFIFPKTRALGALVILPVMVGIILHNATFMPSGLGIAGVMFLINLWIIADNWNKYKPMVA